jgi:hypothetical protein
MRRRNKMTATNTKQKILEWKFEAMLILMLALGMSFAPIAFAKGGIELEQKTGLDARIEAARENLDNANNIRDENGYPDYGARQAAQRELDRLLAEKKRLEDEKKKEEERKKPSASDDLFDPGAYLIDAGLYDPMADIHASLGPILGSTTTPEGIAVVGEASPKCLSDTPVTVLAGPTPVQAAFGALPTQKPGVNFSPKRRGERGA